MGSEQPGGAFRSNRILHSPDEISARRYNSRPSPARRLVRQHGFHENQDSRSDPVESAKKTSSPASDCGLGGRVHPQIAWAKLCALRDDRLAGREYFFDHFTAPDAHFFWCCRRATQLEVDISGFPNVAAHFKRMQERPSVKKLLAYEKEVNEGFAKTA